MSVRSFEDEVKDLLATQDERVKNVIERVLMLQEGDGIKPAQHSLKDDVVNFVRKVVAE